MVQMLKSTKDFNFSEALPWHRQAHHRKFKRRIDFGQGAISRPAPALCMITELAIPCISGSLAQAQPPLLLLACRHE
jgi:hypothetical protein